MLFGKKNPQVHEEPDTFKVKTEKPREFDVKEDRTDTLPAPLDRTVIGEGITFVGNFNSGESMEINGSILGDVHVDHTMMISSTGSYRGNADMRELISEGVIDGKIDCRESVTFSSTAKMVGTLNTPVFTSAAGAAFKGDLNLRGTPAVSESSAPKKEEGDVAVTEKDIFG